MLHCKETILVSCKHLILGIYGSVHMYTWYTFIEVAIHMSVNDNTNNLQGHPRSKNNVVVNMNS
jgi:hypothetical protein